MKRRKNMKDRLIEKIDTFCKEKLGTQFYKNVLEMFADYLLADGWMRPPCKVGDKLHKIHTMYTPFISELKVENYGIPFKDVLGHWGIIPFEEIGKTVFLTREEAEKALKRKEDENADR
jgi:hypothetical protein